MPMIQPCQLWHIHWLKLCSSVGLRITIYRILTFECDIQTGSILRRTQSLVLYLMNYTHNILIALLFVLVTDQNDTQSRPVLSGQDVGICVYDKRTWIDNMIYFKCLFLVRSSATGYNVWHVKLICRWFCTYNNYL